MERCDFSYVIKIIIKYQNEGKALCQTDLMYELFDSFAGEQGFVFDHGLISRWINGYAAVSPLLIQYYSVDNGIELLAEDLRKRVFPILTDVEMVCRDIQDLVMNDISISDSKKTELTNNTDDHATFIATILIFSFQRKFITREAKLAAVTGTKSPVLSDTILCGEAPSPCKHFTGRDNEIEKLHEILQKNYKVFITGIAGIGKSEFVKAFAREYKKEFTNILYFVYAGSLRDMIIDIDFSDDRAEDTDDERFKRHNRYLRSLKEDTLIIIDNFDTTASDEELLDVVMKYKCKVIFTTRSNFDCGYTYSLNEISDIDGLFDLFGKLYSDADKNRDAVINIIEAVNRHTLSVELAARLLEKGLLDPDEVLQKLTECSVDPETSDRINIHKDGKGIKATFYEHIRTLFSLFKLSDGYQFILRCMTFVRVTGIDARLFAHWLSLSDMNDINDLEELGLIKIESSRTSLQPIVKDIAIADLEPSVNNCRDMLTKLQDICIHHGVDMSCYQTFFLYVEDVVTDINNDDYEFYITFIEDAFSYMEKYQYESGMRLIRSVMKSYSNSLKPNDLALYYDFESAVAGMFDKDIKKAIKLSQTALDTCVPEDDLHLAANLNMNLGYNYHLDGQLEPAREYMERAIKLVSEYGKMNNDMLIIYHNYANLMDDCGEPMKAVRAMKKCADLIKETSGENTDYADFRLDIGKIYLKTGDVQKAKENFFVAFNIYASLFGTDSELFESKFTELVGFAESHGIPFNKSYIAIE